MTTNELITFFENELNTLITELELYKNEENIWRIDKNVSNSAGNLSLHLIGNLHTYIGKEIGKTGYIRNRELEFSQKNVSRTTLIDGIHETKEMIKKSLLSISDDELRNNYPILKFSKAEANEYLLVHLLKHLTYHLGQINYHRRLLDE
ncbi:DUF1572 family protein [Aquimarina sp. D1M17]|uniref:DUF1572 family protein n=1 Tax=Aquimarina acroporae TaxID=2937283 RepID=UPI0020C0D07A|nr:DUF1572 family protein [Aquimarina acroporae]MCK8522832.1 DUF1572 family protein [Aquimarina acroporae]